MKKIVLLLLLAAPIVGMSQKKPTVSAADKGKNTSQTSDNLDLSTNSIFYGEIIAMYSGSNPSIRIDMGIDYKAVIENKDDWKNIDAITKRKFQSVAQALNAANAIGFELAGSFDFDTRSGKEVHLVLAKEIVREREGAPAAVQGAKNPNVKRKK